MKLSMSLIGRYLEHYHPEYHITEDVMSIKGLRFLSDINQVSSMDYVYLGRAGSFYQDSRYQDALLLVNGKDQIICWGTDYEDLLNDVLSTFEYYNQFELKMLTAVSEHLSLQEMLQQMGEIYQSPILVFDLDANLLASIHLEKMRDMELLDSLRKRNRMEADILGLTFIDDNGEISHDLTDKPQHLYILERKNEFGAVSMYLYQQEERIGFIMMFPVNQVDLRMSVYLETIFAQYVIMAEEFTGEDSILQPNRSIMHSLLMGESLTAEVIQKFERSIQIKQAACLIAFENQVIQNYTLRSMIIREFSQSDYFALACELDGKIMILTEAQKAEDVIRKLKEKMPFGRYSIGVSMPVRRMTYLSVACKQAIFAMNASTEPGVRYCQKLALQYLIQSLKEQDFTLELTHPAILILKNYDEVNHADLLDTLKVYLQSTCSQIETANKMNIHLNTLKYRLKRISEIGMIDLKDENELFYLQLSMRLADLF